VPPPSREKVIGFRNLSHIRVLVSKIKMIVNLILRKKKNICYFGAGE